MAEHYTPQIGDLVRVGKGKKTWRIESFFDCPARTANDGGATLARLACTEGYSATSAHLGRLTLVERPGESA